MVRVISNIILRFSGWKTEYHHPGIDKYLLIGAPHTSNWDFPLTLLALAGMGVRFSWVAKHTLFWWPFRPFLKAIGGIPVDRSTGTGFLKKVVDLFREKKSFILTIAPEGTRSMTKYWKTGFYTIAVKAEVPIVFGYIDYSKKMIGVCQVFYPTGDINRDFEVIREFYADKQGKYPQKQGEVRAKNRKSG